MHNYVFDSNWATYFLVINVTDNFCCVAGWRAHHYHHQLARHLNNLKNCSASDFCCRFCLNHTNLNIIQFKSQVEYFSVSSLFRIHILLKLSIYVHVVIKQTAALLLTRYEMILIILTRSLPWPPRPRSWLWLRHLWWYQYTSWTRYRVMVSWWCWLGVTQILLYSGNCLQNGPNLSISDLEDWCVGDNQS